MALTLFANATTATGGQLDANFTAVSNQAAIPCSVTGTNTLQLVAKSNVYAVTAYSNNMELTGVASATNTGAMTAQLGSLAALPVYKDSQGGPVALIGNELISGCAFTLLYDAALNSGNGGWHLFSNTSAYNPPNLQIGTSSILSRYLTTLASVTFTVAVANSAQQVIVPLGGCFPGDNILVGPPTNHPTGLVVTGFVSATGSVALNAVNGTGASIASIAAAYRVSVLA
jgi:hypothetical protein